MGIINMRPLHIVAWPLQTDAELGSLGINRAILTITVDIYLFSPVIGWEAAAVLGCLDGLLASKLLYICSLK